jgi:pantoate--beta-alanine ligase
VPRALDAAAVLVARGETRAAAVIDAAAGVIARDAKARIEYCETRDPVTLEAVEVVTGPTLLALAVWVGSVRLIDNRILVPGGQDR